MAALGFVRNESARQLRAGQQPHAGLRDARRRQPVLHRRRQGHRGRRRGRPDLSVFICNSDNRADREARLPRPAPAAAGAGHPDHPGRPRTTRCSTRCAARGMPVVIVDRTRAGGTLCSVAVDDVARRPDRGRAPRSSSGTSGSPSSAARPAIGQVSDRLEGARAGDGRRGARAGPADRAAPPSALTVAEGRGGGERLAGLRRPVARPPRSAPTTCSRSACCSSA